MSIELYDSLAGQVALITGANRGIGAEIARQLTDRDATVYAGARDPSTVEADDQRPVALDVTIETEVEAAMTTIREEAGRLDILVNNAGVYGPTGRLATIETPAIEETLRVNLWGPMLCAKHALPLLTDHSGARIVNVSSGAGQFTDGIDADHLPYGVSKAGLNAVTDALARQYPDLFVNAVCPGWVRTDMGGSEAPRSVEKGTATPVWLARFRDGPSGQFWRDTEQKEW
ncbi:MAG: SDR family NAD(P)-dependent oxidoreductase [Salinirussus sp.]